MNTIMNTGRLLRPHFRPRALLPTPLPRPPRRMITTSSKQKSDQYILSGSDMSIAGGILGGLGVIICERLLFRFDISSMKADIAGMKSELWRVKDSVAKLEEKVTKLEENVTKRLDNLERKIDEEISGLKAILGDMKGKSR
ncbi:hypothetical protein H072_8817 [Dactylellina haptotyla CBS 200.50]|uniref:Uncharacterized protein n=1 Tax=Dactylellina haptotyla (strain CBS 200.50) TaxID=1284197 RepID=S8A8Q6_DACHA|nr:hypothetical protein H072_8817 [Dactylellina haptotyla CBS 200.50]